jgi:xylulokinase
MSERFTIGIDIGTQGTKAGLFSQEGKCLATAFRTSQLHRPGPGIVEEDPERQLASVCRTIRECVGKARISPTGVAAIGIAGQMAGVIGIGADGANVTPYDSWLDARCGPYIVRMTDAAGDEVLRKTGCFPSFNHGPKILWWMHERKSVFRSIRAFVQPGGYAAMRLCGLDARDAFIDKTYLHFSGFADNRGGHWDPALCRAFGLDMAKLPRIVDPHRIVGELAPSMARRCGLRAGVPVVAGCGDTVASFLACGATREGICVDVAGTASVFATTARTFRPDMRHKTLGCSHAATPGLWHPYAYVNGGGMNVEWFLRELANNGRAQGKGRLDLNQLDNLAAKIPLDEPGPMFVPHMEGRVCPSQPLLRGAWVDLSWRHSLGHLHRAVLEGVALEYGIYRNVLAELYPAMKLADVRVTGGGAGSALWNRIKAAVLNAPVVRIAGDAGAPMGAAMLAGFGAGLFESLPEAAARWVRKGRLYSPDRKRTAYYKRQVRRYEKLLESLSSFAASGGQDGSENPKGGT